MKLLFNYTIGQPGPMVDPDHFANLVEEPEPAPLEDATEEEQPEEEPPPSTPHPHTGPQMQGLIEVIKRVLGPEEVVALANRLDYRQPLEEDRDESTSDEPGQEKDPDGGRIDERHEEPRQREADASPRTHSEELPETGMAGVPNVSDVARGTESPIRAASPRSAPPAGPIPRTVNKPPAPEQTATSRDNKTGEDERQIGRPPSINRS